MAVAEASQISGDEPGRDPTPCEDKRALVVVMRCLLVLAVAADAVLIDNHSPRRDSYGNIINAHDGHILHHDGDFWLLGTSYTHCSLTQKTACLGTCPDPASCAYPNNPS